MVVSNSSVLKNNVADIYEQCNYNNKVTYKVILTDTVKKLNIDVANKSATLFAANDMAKFIDYMIDIIEQTKKNDVEFDKYYLLPNMFIGYLTMAYMLKDKDLNAGNYLSIINSLREKINTNTVKNLKIDTKKCSVNKIIAYFENIVGEVI